MIDNAGVLRVNSEKLELSLYRSFSPTTDTQECIQNFISTLSEGLNADQVALLIKSKSGKWKSVKNNLPEYPSVELKIPKDIITELEKKDLLLVDNSLRSQLYVSLTGESILLISLKDSIDAKRDFQWIVSPSRSFYNHYLSLKNQKRNSALEEDTYSNNISGRKLFHDATTNDTSPVGQISLDKDYRIVSYNEAAENFTKFKYGKKISDCTTFVDLLGPKRFKLIVNNLLDKVEKGNSVEFEDTVEVGDEVMYTKKACSPLYSEDNEFIGYAIFITNITKLKESEVVANRSNQIFKNILDLSMSSHLSFDKNLKVIFFNAKAQSIHKDFLGITLKKGMHISSIASNPSSFWNKSKLEIGLPPAGSQKKELVNYTIDGQNIFLDVVITPIIDENNAVIGFTESSTDITESVLESRKVNQQLSILNAVLNSTPNSIYAIDAGMKLLAINHSAQDDFERFCGVRPKVSDDLNDIIDPKILKRWNSEYFSKVLKGKKLSYVGMDSSERVVESMYSPVVDDENNIIGCLEVSSDISELTQNKNELELSEAKLRILVENVPSGIVRSNVKGEILDVSKSASNILGYNFDELKDISLFELLHDEDKESMDVYLNNLLQDDNQITTFRFVHKNGIEVYVEGIGSIINNENDSEPEFLLTFNNVTDKKIIERNLEVVEGNYNALFKNMHDSVLVYNFDSSRLLDHNDAFLKFYDIESLTNISMREIVPKNSEYLPKIDLWKEFEDLLPKIKNRETVRVTSVLYDSKKNEKLVEISIFPSLEEETIAYVMIKDITKSYGIALENKQKTAIYEKLISESAEGIDIVEYNLPADASVSSEMEAFKEYNHKNKVIVRNKLMSKYLNGMPTSVTSIDEMLELLTPIQTNGKTGLETAKQIVVDLMNNNTNKSTEIRLKNGKDYFDINLTQNIIGVKGKLYIIRHLLDITEKKKSEKIIQEQILDLNESNKDLQMYIDSNLQLENFAYIASHDLKAPIRSVISFMQLLRKNIADKVDEKNLKFIDIVLAASTNMQVLIDDLLDYSRINTQAVVFESVDINKLIKGLQRDLITTIEESNTELVIADMPTIVADDSRLRQVFQNLITNGIKFVEKGEKPVINISYKEITDGHQFTVIDNGIGIEEDYLDKIFLMFKKLHSENRYTGTGIGLSICKKVIEQHNGKIWVESELNKGSTFHFTISKQITAN